MRLANPRARVRVDLLHAAPVIYRTGRCASSSARSRRRRHRRLSARLLVLYAQARGRAFNANAREVDERSRALFLRS